MFPAFALQLRAPHHDAHTHTHTHTSYAHLITMPFSQRQLISLTIVVVVFSHWMACAWAGTHYLQSSPELTAEPVPTWLDQVSSVWIGVDWCGLAWRGVAGRGGAGRGGAGRGEMR